MNEILMDPAFGTPGQEALVEARYGEVEVAATSRVREVPLSHSVTTAAVSTGSRTSWVSQNWRILGISYAEVKTTVNYKYRGARATAIDSCNGIVHNYVPLRSIDKYNTESVNSDDAGTCDDAGN